MLASNRPRRVDRGFAPVEDSRRGRKVVVAADDEREAEGGLTMAAGYVAPQNVYFVAVHGRGMAERNNARLGTVFAPRTGAGRGGEDGQYPGRRCRRMRNEPRPGGEGYA